MSRHRQCWMMTASYPSLTNPEQMLDHETIHLVGLNVRDNYGVYAMPVVGLQYAGIA